MMKRIFKSREMIGFLWCLGVLGLVSAAGQTALGQTADVIPYPACPGDPISPDYPSLTVNGKKVEVVQFADIAHAGFEFSQSAQVTITAKDDVTSFGISPHSARIETTAKKNTLTFKLTEPKKLIVTVNGLPKLFVFADAMEIKPPRPGQPGVIEILKAGVENTGQSVQTKKIQAVIDDATLANGGKGGIVYFPPGIYLTGTLFVKSNVTLYLAPGALIKGSEKLEDYPKGPLGTQLIYFETARNAGIAGRGVIDANGQVMREKFQERVKLIRMLNCDLITLDGVVLRNPGSWNTHMVRADHVTLRNVKLINDVNLSNTDAIDPDSVQHMLIEDTFAYAGDDNVAIKSVGRGGPPRLVQDVTIKNCVFWTKKSSLKIGTETRGEGFRDITFENNDVVHADRALVIYDYDGAICDNVRFIDNRAEVVGGDSQQKLIHIQLRKRQGAGQIRNVLIKNFAAEHFSAKHSSITGVDAEHLVSNLTFENLTIEGKKRMSLEEAQIDANEFVKDVVFK